jgi:SAM-dependent methyltransferase
MSRVSSANSRPDPREGRRYRFLFACGVVLLTSPVPAAEAPPAVAGQPAASSSAPRAGSASIHADRAHSPLLDRFYERAEAPSAAPPSAPGPEIFERRFQIVYTIAPRPGMRVADIGVGNGHFAALFARAVGPEGLVYGVGDTPERVAVLDGRAREYRVRNLQPVIRTREDTRLPADGVDLAFIGGSYSGLEDPRAILDSIHRALVPYGTLIIVEPRDLGGTAVVRPGGRPDRDAVVAQVQEAGFRLVDEPAFLDDSFFLRFERIGDEPDLRVGPIQTDVTPPPP